MQNYLLLGHFPFFISLSKEATAKRQQEKRKRPNQKQIPIRIVSYFTSQMNHRQWASNIDMYRKVPLDLLDGTKRGSIISIIALITMVLLFFMETVSFFSGAILETDVSLDFSTETKLRVNINITMLDLKCDYATVDIVR